MNRLFIKLLLFTSIFFVLNFTLIQLVPTPEEFERNQSKDQELQKTINEVEYLFFGHSRVSRAIDSSLIKRSFPFSSAAECYPFIYYKLRYITKHYPDWKGMVLLPCEFSSVRVKNEQLLTNAAYWKKYFNFYEYGKISGSISKTLGLKIKIELFPYFQNARTYIGRKLGKLSWYEGSKMNSTKQRKNVIEMTLEERKLLRTNNKTKDRSDKILRQFKRKSRFAAKNFFPDGELADDVGLEYLRMILELAKAENFNLVFIKYPITQTFYEAAVWRTKHSLWQQDDIDSLILSYENVEILDFLSIYFDRFDYFRDVHHLNEYGRDSFSIMLNDTLPYYAWQNRL